MQLMRGEQTLAFFGREHEDAEALQAAGLLPDDGTWVDKKESAATAEEHAVMGGRALPVGYRGTHGGDVSRPPSREGHDMDGGDAQR